MKRLHIIGSTLRARPKDQKVKIVQEFWSFAEEKFKSGAMRPIVDKVFPLSEAKQAHEYMEAKKNAGKIVLKVE